MRALILLCSIASLSVLTLAALFRPLVMECADPQFLRSVSGLSAVTHFTFLTLVVMNLVGGFHALGTLMAVGIMILPAAAARFWAESIGGLILSAVTVAMLSSLSRPPALLPLQPAVRAGDHPRGGYRLRGVAGVRAGGQSCRAAPYRALTSNPERKRHMSPYN